MNVFKVLWNHTEVSDKEWEIYFKYKKEHPDADILPPISGRGMIISFVSAIVLVATIVIALS